MTMLLFLPLVIPLATAVLSILAAGRLRIVRTLSIAGAAAHVVSAVMLIDVVARGGIVAVQAGGWPAPFGITLVADMLSALLLCVGSVMGLAIAGFAIASVGSAREMFGFHPMLHLLMLGVSGAFLTGDLFNLYVWYEVMLMSSFVLLTLGGTRLQLAGGVNYVVINLLSSLLFLAAAGMLYGAAGSLNMADVAGKWETGPQPAVKPVLAFLLFASFGIKAALVPLHCWLPASYHTPPVAVTALFSALLTKVGVYSILRTFTLLFPEELARVQGILLVVAGLTMLVGVLGAVAQMDVRRLLAFHIVSQIGYLLFGLAVFTPLALAGTVYFFIHVILAKSSLFLVAGILERHRGTYSLKKLGGSAVSAPLLSAAFLIGALSLAGLPPTSGFWAKLLLVLAGLEAGQWLAVAVALVTSLLTLFSMIKIWNEAFWKPAPEGEPLPPPAPASVRITMAAPLGILSVLLLSAGLTAGPLLEAAFTAADQLTNTAPYIEAVLGGHR